MPRILHLGYGNFHRAHQACYTAKAGGWTITGVSMRRPDLRNTLAPDDFAYTLAERGPTGLTVTRITVHDRLLVAAENPSAVIQTIADSDTAIVTLTVTEKGYHLRPDGTLDLTDPAITADLQTQTPTTTIGLLALGLAARQTPITVISCDNLSGNGEKLRAAIKAFWSAANLPGRPSDIANFPDTMVDRITPATTDAMRTEIAAQTGHPEPEPVLTEAFTDWIIQDDFAGPRPAWETAGAQFVQDVAPYESRKLLMLNASHSYLAYAGLAKGHTYVHEAIADPHLRTGTEALWDAAAPCLPLDTRSTSDAYRAALIDRFSVPEMRHALAQIAMDGSAKMTQRILPILTGTNHAPAALAALAAWIAFAIRTTKAGQTISDPEATGLQTLAQDPNAAAKIIAKIGYHPPDTVVRDLSQRVAIQLSQNPT
ncbi:MAG: mannitol dehydrogenase family protein [Rhodobacteraceae bacterium]|nr:mannitol dehydrogenase family protein [Paracoccaceae bacterium]